MFYLYYDNTGLRHYNALWGHSMDLDKRIVELPAVTRFISLKCCKCADGSMVKTGQVFQQNQQHVFENKCDKCGQIENLPNGYPYVVHYKKETDDKPTNIKPVE